MKLIKIDTTQPLVEKLGQEAIANGGRLTNDAFNLIIGAYDEKSGLGLMQRMYASLDYDFTATGDGWDVTDLRQR